MFGRLAVLVSLLVLVGCRHSGRPPAQPVAPPPGLAAWVDPLIGTDDGDSPDPPPGDKGGATFPGATVPFGMVQWSPDTQGGEFGYSHPDRDIRGFSLNHISGAGCAALLDFPFMPIAVPLEATPSENRTPYLGRFSHAHEQARAGAYEVTLDSGLAVRITATTRTGFAEFHFPPAASAGLLVDAGKSVSPEDFSTRVVDSELQALGDDRLVGWLESEGFCGTSKEQPRGRYRVHFVARFDQPFTAVSSWDADGVHAGVRQARAPKGGLHVAFAPGSVVKVKVGLSYVSNEGAARNLEAESPGWDFKSIAAAATARWDDVLGRVRVAGGTNAHRRMFYTALYHTLLHPNVASDVDGAYTGFDIQPHVARGYTHYANFSGWDIYRSWVQLAALVAPDQLKDMLRSLVINADVCGALPRWTLGNDETGVMVGDPAALILANAHAFGIRGFDRTTAMKLMLHNATDPKASCGHHTARAGMPDYLERGYLPIGGKLPGPPSVTLEYAAADFAVAQMARAMGDVVSYAALTKRSANWKNVFDDETRYMRPRLANARWAEPFKPNERQGFIEGNAAQYTFFVPHDAHGLIQKLGGPERAVARLDDLFTMLNAGITQPHFYIGNEPQFGTPWLYDFAGAPWRTQQVVRQILTRTFTDQPGGLPGNDDLGATSSWYVFAALGLYPAIPGVGGFVVGSPMFPGVTIQAPGRKAIQIDAPAAGADRPYVRGLSIDGKVHDSTWIGWDRLAGGAKLRFDLVAEPDRKWATGPNGAPPSFVPQ